MSSQPACRRVAPAPTGEGLNDRGWLVIGRLRVDTGVEGSLTVAAGINHEVRRGYGSSHVLLIPLVGVDPSRNVVWIDRSERRIVLAGAIRIVPQPPAALLRIIPERDAIGDPGIIGGFVVVQIEVRHVGEKSLRLLNP